MQADIFFVERAYRWPDQTRGEGGSHGCSAYKDFLMPWNNPRHQEKPGEGSHGCSAYGDFFDAAERPQAPGEARGR